MLSLLEFGLGMIAVCQGIGWVVTFCLWLEQPELGAEHPLLLSEDQLKCSDKMRVSPCFWHRDGGYHTPAVKSIHSIYHTAWTSQLALGRRHWVLSPHCCPNAGNSPPEVLSLFCFSLSVSLIMYPSSLSTPLPHCYL